MTNKNKKLAVLMSVVLLILIAGVVIVSKTKNLNVKAPNNEAGAQTNEADKIKEANKEVLNNINEETTAVKPIDKNDYYQGNLSAPIQIIIYNDFDFPFYNKVSDTLNKVKQEFGDKAVIAFRHFPLAIHTNAMSAALASECAAEQGKFWEMHDRLFKDYEEEKMNAGQYKKDAAELKLDQDKFSKCFGAEKYKDKINAQMEEGKKAGAGGVPTYFVNGRPIAGAVPFDDYTASDGIKEKGMKSIIEKSISK